MWRSTIIVLVLMLGLQLEAATATQKDQKESPNKMEKELEDWEGFEDIYGTNEDDESHYTDEDIETEDEQDTMSQYVPQQDTELKHSTKNVTMTVAHCLLRRDFGVNLRTYADNILIGGTGGTLKKFNSRGNKGKRIIKITMWAKPRELRGVEIILASGCNGYGQKRYMCGTRTGYLRTFNFAYGERITQLKVWGNERCASAGRVTRVYFKTNGGRTFSIGQAKGYPYIPHIGRGIPGGMLLRCGTAIDALAFLLFN